MIIAERPCTEMQGRTAESTTFIQPSHKMTRLSNEHDIDIDVDHEIDMDMDMDMDSDHDIDSDHDVCDTYMYMYEEISVHTDDELELEDDVNSLEDIEELLGSSLESFEDIEQNEGNDFQRDDHHHHKNDAVRSQLPSATPRHTESLTLSLEDSPRTRRKKFIEADELVLEEEEDDIESETGADAHSFEEDYESTGSSPGLQ